MQAPGFLSHPHIRHPQSLHSSSYSYTQHFQSFWAVREVYDRPHPWQLGYYRVSSKGVSASKKFENGQTAAVREQSERKYVGVVALELGKVYYCLIW